MPRIRKIVQVITLLLFCSFDTSIALSQANGLQMHYTISIDEPELQSYHLELQVSEWVGDKVSLKMPNWMPGYYQLMDYAKGLENMLARDKNGNQLAISKDL